MGKLEYTTAATLLCQPEFTIPELARLYEIVWQCTIDYRNFHRKVVGSEDFVVPTGGYRTQGGRPAALYRRGDAVRVHPSTPRPRG
jgi:8-oxo-dGTP diphosphatase